MTKEETDEEIESLREELQFLDQRLDAVETFLGWLYDSLEFAIMDIAEGSETPLEVVDSEVVLQKYKEYLAEYRAELQQEIKELQELLNSGTDSATP